MITLRDYQTECVEAIWKNLDKHVVAALPTGSGKTPVIAEVVTRILTYQGTHILVLAHKRELIRQNVATLERHISQADVGVYCAGLGQKQMRQVTVATVQSLVRAKELPNFEVIIVDEAHLVPSTDTGQYRTLFARLPNARIIGLTATPYRMDHGLLHEGDERLFDALVYEAKTSTLIKQGWLSPIRARATSGEANLENVHLRGGEYKPDEMIAAMDQAAVTQAAVKDVLEHAKDRTSILVFCAGVEHAKHVEAAFRQAGQNSIAVVTQETSMHDRDEATANFKERKLRLLLNVGCFTTGFDAPNVDCIVMLRATKSPGLYVQILGRGLRKCDGKKDCLFLDYGAHVERFGPLDMITARRANAGQGAPPIKTCPQCGTKQFAGRRTCEYCGIVFPRDISETTKHNTQAGALDPIAPAVLRTLDVKEVEYVTHKGRDGKPDSMLVNYYSGMFERVQEWVCPQHQGFPQQKAQAWFARRGVVPMPHSIPEAIELARTKCLWPTKITVKKNGKYDEIVNCSGWKAANGGGNE